MVVWIGDLPPSQSWGSISGAQKEKASERGLYKRLSRTERLGDATSILGSGCPRCNDEPRVESEKMLYEDLSRALTHRESIRQFIILNPGGREHSEVLKQIRDLLASADGAVEDYECKRLIRLIEQAASELFSASEHAKWARGKTSGADVLRLQILRDLDAFKNRLTTIETMRSSTGRQRSAVLTRLNKA